MKEQTKEEFVSGCKRRRAEFDAIGFSKLSRRRVAIGIIGQSYMMGSYPSITDALVAAVEALGAENDKTVSALIEALGPVKSDEPIIR